MADRSLTYMHTSQTPLQILCRFRWRNVNSYYYTPSASSKLHVICTHELGIKLVYERENYSNSVQNSTYEADRYTSHFRLAQIPKKIQGGPSLLFCYVGQTYIGLIISISQLVCIRLGENMIFFIPR